jgi:AcrR family transcriptional regulator
VFEPLLVHGERRRSMRDAVVPAPLTARHRAKADRRASLLAAAVRLFARHGFEGVSMEELGAAAGVSGPAVYRHFASKQAVLAALLVDASHGLCTGGRAVVQEADDDADALRSLVRFHVAFAVREPDVIRVQDRDLDALADSDRRTVTDLQRAYIELWVATLVRLRPSEDPAEHRVRARATFGLMNSTPHSARSLPQSRVREVLEAMALAALGHARP